MHHPTDRIAHTTAVVTPVVEHWLEREIAQWVHPMKDRSDDPSHHEQTLLPRSYILLLSTWDLIFIWLGYPLRYRARSNSDRKMAHRLTCLFLSTLNACMHKCLCGKGTMYLYYILYCIDKLAVMESEPYMKTKNLWRSVLSKLFLKYNNV